MKRERFAIVPGWVFDTPKLTSSEKLVVAGLCLYRNKGKTSNEYFIPSVTATMSPPSCHNVTTPLPQCQIPGDTMADEQYQVTLPINRGGEQQDAPLGAFERFRDIWVILTDLYGKAMPNPQTLQIVFGSLKQFQIGDISAAASYYVRTGKFMPRPADLAEIIIGTTEDRARAGLLVAIAAAERIRSWKHVHFDDDNTMVVINALGGWSEFCHLLKVQRPQTESRFIKWYQASMGMRNKDVPYMLRTSQVQSFVVREHKMIE